MLLLLLKVRIIGCCYGYVYIITVVFCLYCLIIIITTLTIIIFILLLVNHHDNIYYVLLFLTLLLVEIAVAFFLPLPANEC